MPGMEQDISKGIEHIRKLTNGRRLANCYIFVYSRFARASRTANGRQEAEVGA